jgi:hypothetical protein
MRSDRWSFRRLAGLAVIVGAGVFAQSRDSAADTCATTPFVSAAEYTAGFLSTNTAIGDFTNDGKPDVVVTTLDTLMVFPGNGDGTFGAARTSPFNATGTIVTGFFDGDANLDIAVAASSSVFVLLGNGDGTFQDAVAYPGSTNSSNTMRSGLFNADANLDLVETDFNGSIRVFLGNGDGTFAPGVSYGVTGAPVDLAVADFNGDGHADVVAALGGFDDSSFALFLGVGDGTFSAPTLVPAGGQPTSIAAADLDADGYADVALGVLPGIVILRGNGNGTFQAPIPYAVAGNRVAQLIALDLDGDGRLDLAALQPSSAASVMLEILQTPNRTFTVGPGYIAPSGFLAAGDLNADGLPDFALPGLNMPVMSVLVSTGVGSYLAARSVAPGLAPHLVAAGDFDGDGQTDLFVGGVGDTINSAVLLNEDGTFRVASTLPDGAQFAVAAELTGDTNIDLFVSSFGAATLLIGHGDGTFTAAASFPSSARATASSPPISTGMEFPTLRPSPEARTCRS